MGHEEVLARCASRQDAARSEAVVFQESSLVARWQAEEVLRRLPRRKAADPQGIPSTLLANHSQAMAGVVWPFFLKCDVQGREPVHLEGWLR